MSTDAPVLSGIEDGTEKSSLLAGDNFHESIDNSGGSASFGTPRRKRGGKSSIQQSRNYVEITNFSTTTVIGLLLLVAMITLTILSICLQRYSTNTYVDIIVPPHNSTSNSSSIDTVTELIL